MIDIEDHSVHFRISRGKQYCSYCNKPIADGEFVMLGSVRTVKSDLEIKCSHAKCYLTYHQKNNHP